MTSTNVIYNSKNVSVKPVINDIKVEVKEEIEIKDEPLESIGVDIQFKTENYEEPIFYQNDFCSINYCKISDGEKLFQCSHCTCKDSFIENLRRYNGERLYKCSNCKLASTDKRIIEHHLGLGISVKPVINDIEVEVKEEIEIKDEPLESIGVDIQLKTENYEEPTFYQNDFCPIKYREISDEEKRFQCSHCTCKDSCIENLRRYNGEILYKCSNCKLASTDKRIIEHHLGLGIYTAEKPDHCNYPSQVHNGEKPYQCHLCNQAFDEKIMFTGHLRIHEGKGKKPYKCNKCARAFAALITLERHLHRIHNSRKTFKCSQCDRAFPSIMDRNIHLKKHLLRIHTCRKTFKCNRCDKAFPSKMDLNIHLKNHNAANLTWFLADE